MWLRYIKDKDFHKKQSTSMMKRLCNIFVDVVEEESLAYLWQVTSNYTWKRDGMCIAGGVRAKFILMGLHKKLFLSYDQ